MIEDIAASMFLKPYDWALFSQDWGEGQLQGKAIRAWQEDLFRRVQSKLEDDKTRHMPIKIGVGAGHGIGKSACIGMFLSWAMSTMPDTRCVITANTETQMRTKTMPEVYKWFNSSINSEWFQYSATSFAQRDAPNNWRLDFVTWSEHNTEAFAGLHNEGRRIVLVFDEASAIADKVWEVAEGAMTDKDTQIIWLAFGNMTRNTGRFFDIQYENDWDFVHIDSRVVEGTNKEFLNAFVEKYGEDSDIVRVRVRGLPPLSGEDSFISMIDVEQAMKRVPDNDNKSLPIVISVDPSWTGGDEFVIAARQGMKFWVLDQIPSNDNDVQMQNKIARYEDELMADDVLVDAGYGTGIVSVARAQGRNWKLVQFGGKASKPEFANKRAEMWSLMKDWIREGGCLPDNPQLKKELVSCRLEPRVDGRIQLESKIKMKRDGRASPNIADALAISFAYPVYKRDRMMEEFRQFVGEGVSKDDFR